jgi:membrane-bound ClpP family serine protease
VRSDTTFKILMLISVGLAIANFLKPGIALTAALSLAALLLAVSARDKGPTARSITSIYLAATLLAVTTELFMPDLVTFGKTLVLVVMALVLLGAGKAYSLTTSSTKLRKCFANVIEVDVRMG